MPEHLLFAYAAFGELSTCRQIGMSVGPVPWVAIDRFAERHGLAPDEFDFFLSLIRLIETAVRDRKGE